MASYINTNMASWNTQNNLSKSQGALNTSIQRLSSGLRINSAKDDAAGMAIASKMDSLIRGQNVAVRNTNDAISYSQTAEGSLTKIGENLQRMRELAVQSANGTNNADDRTALNQEFSKLQDEIKRVKNNTKFNEQQVFDGNARTFQIGAGTSSYDTISVAGVSLTDTDAVTNNAPTSLRTGLTNAFGSTAGGVANLTFNTTTGVASVASGFTASSDQETALTNYNQSVKKISAEFSSGTTLAFDAATGSLAATGSASVSTHADYSVAARINGGSGTSYAIDTQAHATSAIDKLDLAIKEVNSKNIEQGANQNRFAVVISTLQTSTENQTAARSRITDTDYASETATLARNQILQQAGMAMLSQANQLPNSIMSLLR
jgi:flagellin